eukprot:639239_1
MNNGNFNDTDNHDSATNNSANDPISVLNDSFRNFAFPDQPSVEVDNNRRQINLLSNQLATALQQIQRLNAQNEQMSTQLGQMLQRPQPQVQQRPQVQQQIALPNQSFGIPFRANQGRGSQFPPSPINFNRHIETQNNSCVVMTGKAAETGYKALCVTNNCGVTFTFSDHGYFSQSRCVKHGVDWHDGTSYVLLWRGVRYTVENNGESPNLREKVREINAD